MRKNIIVTSLLCLISLISWAGASDTLRISGTVPDRGYAILNGGSQVGLQAGTELKVFIATTKKSSRSPQSVGEAQIAWQRVHQPENLNATSYIRVEAP